MHRNERIYCDYDSEDYVNHDDDVVPPTITICRKKNTRDYSYSQRQPVLEEYDAETSRKMSIRKYESKMNSTKTEVKSDMPEVKDDINEFMEFMEFKSQMKYYINKMGQYYKWSSSSYIDDLTQRLFAQCKTAQELFEYILSNVDLIAKRPELRKLTGIVNKRSFIQVLILKCVQLSKEINVRYDTLCKTHPRTNPSVRSAKSACLNAIKNAQIALSKKYNEHRIERETLQELLASQTI